MVAMKTTQTVKVSAAVCGQKLDSLEDAPLGRISMAELLVPLLGTGMVVAHEEEQRYHTEKWDPMKGAAGVR